MGAEGSYTVTTKLFVSAGNPLQLPQEARIMMSPALRTMQTAQALGRTCEEVAALAPGAPVDAILTATGWPDADGCVVAVGHQPTLGQVAVRLLTGQGGDIAFRKGGIWWFQSRMRQGELQVILKAVVKIGRASCRERVLWYV